MNSGSGCSPIVRNSAIGYYLRVSLLMNIIPNLLVTYHVSFREFEIIGEAVGNLTESFRKRRPDVEWHDIKDFRNLLSHEYFGVDLEIVWKTQNGVLAT